MLYRSDLVCEVTWRVNSSLWDCAAILGKDPIHLLQMYFLMYSTLSTHPYLHTFLGQLVHMSYSTVILYCVEWATSIYICSFAVCTIIVRGCISFPVIYEFSFVTFETVKLWGIEKGGSHTLLRQSHSELLTVHVTYPVTSIQHEDTELLIYKQDRKASLGEI